MREQAMYTLYPTYCITVLSAKDLGMRYPFISPHIAPAGKSRSDLHSNICAITYVIAGGVRCRLDRRGFDNEEYANEPVCLQSL